MYIIINKDDEIFKQLTYPDVRPNTYLISNYGNVYSKLTNKLLTAYEDSKGYMRVMLTCKNKKGHTFKVHRLVAWEFCDGYSDICNEVNHKDSLRYHNYYENLEWISSKENSIHAFEHGLRKAKKGTEHYRHKYPESLIKHIKSMLLNGYTTNDIMKYFSYQYSKDNTKLASLISDIKKGKAGKDIEGSTTIENYCIFIQE